MEEDVGLLSALNYSRFPQKTAQMLVVAADSKKQVACWVHDDDEEQRLRDEIGRQIGGEVPENITIFNYSRRRPVKWPEPEISGFFVDEAGMISEEDYDAIMTIATQKAGLKNRR